MSEKSHKPVLSTAELLNSIEPPVVKQNRKHKCQCKLEPKKVQIIIFNWLRLVNDGNQLLSTMPGEIIVDMTKFAYESAIDKPQRSIMIKAMIIGERRVGKSSILYRYSDNSFKTRMSMFGGTDFRMANILSIEEWQCKIQLWDTTRDIDYETVMDSHYRTSRLIFVIYDISNHNSFDKLSSMIEEISTKRNKCKPALHIVIIGNKMDCDEAPPPIEDETVNIADPLERQVTTAEVEKLCLDQKWDPNRIYFGGEVSCKTGENVVQLINGSVEKYVACLKMCPYCQFPINSKGKILP